MEWTSVKDGLPEDQVVLVYCGIEVGIGGHSKEYGWWATGINDGEDAEITHWMPLPEDPK